MKRVFYILLALVLLLCGCAASQRPEQTALTPKPLAPNAVTPNPYMAASENSVHNDSYGSDVSNAVLPLGIDPVVNVSLETQNPQAPSAAFYDEYGAMVTPYNGGIAIADMTGDVIRRQGVFVPAVHDTEPYRVQISYSFVDSENRVVLPTSHGHVIILQTRDETGAVLPVFQKVLDVDISQAAVQALGPDVDTRLLSVVYDYDGNLWFVTGGFRILPERDPAGFLGYLSREYVEKALADEEVSPADYLHFYRLTQGESAENGISSAEYGAVILTNKTCYLLQADDGVQVLWQVDYDSNGAKDALAGSAYTGGGLAYGSGTTPTLTKELVLFTDNLDPVNLIAVEAATGQVVTTIPVLDQLGKDTPVAVENSILVYSGSPERTSVVICNWFGAGNAGLSDPNADSAVQSYANLYDANWMSQGNVFIAPGVERVDVVKTGNGYRGEKVWVRKDVRDTAMIKLSTATGYVYGYWQNLDTGMWCYEVLDFETGKTVYEQPVSGQAPYNNVAVGMINDVGGNALYCPTNAMEMLVWQDRFVSLPEVPGKAISPHHMTRHVLSEADFQSKSGTSLSPASYLMGVGLDNLAAESTICFQVNGLTGKAADLTLFCRKADGSLAPYAGPWTLTQNGKAVTTLAAEQIYDLQFPIQDGGSLDTNEAEKAVTVSVILAK